MAVTQKEPRTGLLIAAIVCGIIVVQMFAKHSEPRKRPGVDRGDLRLVQSDLPDEIDGWHFHSFNPAPEPDQLPPGQYWWVHQWVYEKDSAQALVTLDQLGESGWHELTYCYHGSGWQIDTRTRLYDAESEGSYVLTELSRGAGERAILLFSVFFEDGSWATPPDVMMDKINDVDLKPGFLGRLENRVAPTIMFGSEDSGHDRALQCQTLLSFNGHLADGVLEELLVLHLSTRQAFQEQWLKHHQVMAR